MNKIIKIMEKSLYFYENKEDTERGSVVFCIAESIEEAESKITHELLKFGLVFEPTNIQNVTKLSELSSSILYSDSGDN